MKFAVPFVVLFCQLFTITAQEVAVSKDGKSVAILLNPNGNFITNLKSGEVKGSPMLSDQWSIGSVAFLNGLSIDSVQLQFNLETNKLLFRQQGLVLEFVDTVKEAVLNFNMEGSNQQVLIRNNYPPVDGSTGSEFYLVLAAGNRFQLLQYRLKKKVEQYRYGNTPDITYSELNQLFIYETATGQMHKIKERKSAVLNALPASTTAIENICREKKLKIKSTSELIVLVNLLNKM